MAKLKFFRRQIIGWIFLLLSVGVLAYYLVYSPSLPEGKNADNPYLKVFCDVKIADGVFGKPYIKTYSCYSSGKCSPLLPFTLFFNEGNLLMQMGEKVESKDYKTFKVGGDYDLTLNQCTTFRSGTLKLNDDKNNVIETINFDIK